MAVVNAFFIDIEDSAGTKQGAGPITSASGWTYTASMDRAGSFWFTMPASDDMADEVQKKRIARAWALVGGVWTEIGAGIIDSITKQPQADGQVILSVSGESEERELTYRSVGFLELFGWPALPITHAEALTLIGAYKPSGWTLTADGSPGNDSVYGRFAGESVLQALIALGDKSQSHFYRSGPKAITFASTFADSGVRAIRATDDLTTATCAIVELQERIDTHELITRIYPFGAGQGRARLTLAACTRSAGSGYTLSTSNNYIENDTAEATYGRIEQYLEYKDIAPISNTDADVEAAANMLYDVALEELTRRSTELEQATYSLRLAECGVLLRPMQTIRVVYWDPDAGMDIDADLNILEATIQVDASGLRTTGVVVSNSDRWPDNDTDIIAGEMTQGMIFQAHPQLNANSYTTSYNKTADTDEDAALYFRLGEEVAQVQQVVFDFQLLPLESTIRSVAAPGTTDGSGELTTGSGGAGSSGTPSNDTSGAATGNTGAATGNTGAATGSTGAATGSTGAATGSTGTATGNTGAATGNTGAATGNTGGTVATMQSTTVNVVSTTVGINESGTLETEEPQGGDVVAAGRHEHHTEITLGAASVTYPVGFGAAGTSGGLVSTYGSGSFDMPVNQSGNHTHELDPHTHVIDSHDHTVDSHSHTVDSHTHTMNSHVHDMNSHAHSLNSHDHSLNSHDHSLNSHDHSLNNHTHGLGSHTHGLGSHTHSLNSHTHDLNNHEHAFDVKIDTLFGIYRESSNNTADIGNVDYQVNSGGWTALSTDAVSLGGDWYRLDITSDIVDSDTLRPLQAANTVEFRITDQTGNELLTLSAITVDQGTAVGTISGVDEAVQVGDRIQVADSEDAFEDGIHIVTAYDGSEVEWRTTGYDASDTGLAALVYRAYTVQIDGLLSVRNIIQAVAYT